MYSFVKLKSILFWMLVFSLVLPAFLVHAQTEALRINVTPSHPQPFETVVISVEDFSRDLNKSEMSWSVDGKVVSSGVGLKNVSFKTGDLGTATKVDINMGGVVETVILRPSVTDLLWQADTYTPPFYKGKALHTAQDPVTVYAEPFIVNKSGTRISPDNLVYKWKLDGSVNSNASGYGKKTFTITPSILVKPINVSVEITSTDNLYGSEASIVIPNSNPEVVFYENHPLYGIRSSEALNGKDFTVVDSEARIIGEPFFFSNAQKDFNLLTYEWSLNNSKINQLENTIIVRTPSGEGSGRSLISLKIKNLERFLQTAGDTLYAVYGNNPEQQTQSVF